MKRILSILIVVLFSYGCASTTKGPLGIEPTKYISCPDLVKEAAANLEHIGIDHEKVEKWKNDSLEVPQQPCSVCRKLNDAIYILADESGEYQNAMKKTIQAIEEYDPNSTLPTKEQEKEIGNTLMDNSATNNYTLADRYIGALDDLQTFMMTELRISPYDARNFVLDHYFIPLLKEGEQTK